MNCDRAREIINLEIDGKIDKDSNEALKHVEICEECRAWYSQTTEMLDLLDGSFETLPVPDLRSSIMAALPNRHPASVGHAPVRRRIAVALAVSWLGGASITVLAILVAIRMYSLNDIAYLAAGIRSSFGFLPQMPTFSSVMASATLHVVGSISAITGAAWHYSPLIGQFLVLDSLFLLGVAMIWRYRKSIRSTFTNSIVGI